MSNRKDEFKTESTNPVKIWLEWDSKNKQLKYYDKEKKENVLIPLPFKFLVLKEFHTVKGFHDASQSGIYSNEVKYIGNEPVEVKSFKGGSIASGLYSEIKNQVQSAGGKYYKSIYAMSEKGSLINISIKGSAVAAWSEFTQKTRSRLSDEWVSITKAEDGKKGSIDYSVPVFEFTGSLNDADSSNADSVYDVIDDYFSAPSARKAEAAEDTADNENVKVPF